VFGEDVRVWGSQTGHSNIKLEEAGDTYCVAEVSECELKRDKSDSNFSVWKVEPAINVNGTPYPVYMRLRFPVRSLGRLWKWRKMMDRHGAVVDLRVNDLRGSFDVPEGQDYSDKIIQIEQLNCFVIAPIYFPIQKVNPGLKYMRLIEGRRWESYLGRATDLLRKGKLQIVFMRDAHVGTDNEFRGTVSLGSKSNTSWLTWLFATVLFALLLFLFSSPDHISNTFASDLLNTLGESASWVWRTLAGIISIPIVFKLIKQVWGYDSIKKLSIAFRKSEHRLFRFFSSTK